MRSARLRIMVDDLDDAADAFHAVYALMYEADLEALERLARTKPPFPSWQDGWLGRHWLTHAIHSRQYAAFDWVLSKNVPVNFEDKEGDSPLASLLAGADVNFRHTLDVTPLHIAARASSPAVVRHLLICGADPHVCGADGIPRLPIDYAHRSRWPSEIRQLLGMATSK